MPPTRPSGRKKRNLNGKIGKHATGVNARYDNELKVHNRFDGQAFFLTVSLGL